MLNTHCCWWLIAGVIFNRAYRSISFTKNGQHLGAAVRDKDFPDNINPDDICAMVGWRTTGDMALRQTLCVVLCGQRGAGKTPSQHLPLTAVKELMSHMQDLTPIAGVMTHAHAMYCFDAALLDTAQGAT